MELDSVRSLKQELAVRLMGERLMTRRELPVEAGVATSALPEFAPRAPIALGISGDGGGYRLAIRVVELTPGVQPLVDSLVEAAHGEASVRMVGRVVKQAPWHRSRNRPLLIGGSVGHPNVTAGTIGGFVVEEPGADLLLSNNHILADENNAASGDAIWQQARSDLSGAPPESVATLHRFVPLDGTGINLVDAAVARLLPGFAAERTTLTGIGQLEGVRPDPIQSGEQVRKLGRTTGKTRGTVRAFEIDSLPVGYDRRTLIFDNQIEIERDGAQPFSLGGDSGSLIVDDENRAVGLLFAGNDVDLTYANPIETVLGELGVRFP